MAAIQYIQILIEDALSLASHTQTFLLIVILPPTSPHRSSDWPYLPATCDLYEPRDVMSDELKVRLLGLSNSEKCTCLVIFSEAAAKLWGQVVFQTRRWPNYSRTHRPATWVTRPQETVCMTFVLSCNLKQLIAQIAPVQFCPRDDGNILSAESNTNSSAVYFGRRR